MSYFQPKSLPEVPVLPQRMTKNFRMTPIMCLTEIR